jgi:hypothetical protein
MREINYSGARVTPSFFPPDDAVQALVALHDRPGEAIIQEIVTRIAWLTQPAVADRKRSDD